MPHPPFCPLPFLPMQARMLMRQSGNFRLLLNANVFANMALQLLGGGGGVTFACANAAAADGGSTPVRGGGVGRRSYFRLCQRYCSGMGSMQAGGGVSPRRT